VATEYVTVADVEIISAGRNWKGGSSYYITGEHLSDMVAAQADPLIRAPRVKLGHWDTLFGALAGMHDPTVGSTDGEPGFGTVCNLRLVEGGAKIIGDLTEVPDWLAAAMPSAYPTRSAEWVWDHETQGGHCYTAVLTDLALGGVWEPAVEDLADITREQATAALQVLLEQGPEAALAALTTPEEAPMATKTATASVSVDRIVGQFEDWAWNEDDQHDGFSTYWWFARDIRLDPDEVIAGDGEGGTFRVPFSTDGEHGVTFGTPVEVRETYVDVTAPAAAASAAQDRHSQRVLAHDLPVPDRITNQARASAEPDHEEKTMDESVRTFLERQGLDPETVTEDQINAASVFAAASALPDHEPKTTADLEPDPAPDPVLEPAAAATDPVADEQARKLEETSREVAELKAAAAAREDREIRERRDGLATAWVQEGRITPAEHDHYRGLLDINEDGTVALASKLAAGRVPVDGRRGTAAADTEITTTGWFPQLTSKEA
jgi:hypothetical protein